METVREAGAGLPTITPNGKAKRGLDPHWAFLRDHSTKALLGCIETLKDEFKQRGLILVVDTTLRRDNTDPPKVMGLWEVRDLPRPE